MGGTGEASDRTVCASACCGSERGALSSLAAMARVSTSAPALPLSDASPWPSTRITCPSWAPAGIVTVTILPAEDEAAPVTLTIGSTAPAVATAFVNQTSLLVASKFVPWIVSVPALLMPPP